MILIGITGAIGHGKTSLADAILKLEPSAIHDESSKLISEFANEAKKTIPKDFDIAKVNDWIAGMSETMGCELGVSINTNLPLIPQNASPQDPEFTKLDEYMSSIKRNSSLCKEEITEITKPNHRALLQWMGGYFVNHISRTIWYDELIRRSETAKQSGCKLYVIGGLRFPEDAEVIKKAGGKVIEIVRPSAPKPDLSDPTERERANIISDIRLLNNGDISDLEKLANTLLEDLIYHSYSRKYSSIA